MTRSEEKSASLSRPNEFLDILYNDEGRYSQLASLLSLQGSHSNHNVSGLVLDNCLDDSTAAISVQSKVQAKGVYKFGMVVTFASCMKQLMRPESYSKRLWLPSPVNSITQEHQIYDRVRDESLHVMEAYYAAGQCIMTVDEGFNAQNAKTYIEHLSSAIISLAYRSTE